MNTFTGVRYRDEPPSWLGRSATSCAAGAAGGSTAVVDTVRELADVPARGCARTTWSPTAGEGFDDAPGLYAGLSNRYPVRGDEGASFSKLAAIDALDMVSYHLYPRSYGLRNVRDIEIWIQRHQAIGLMNDKIAYLGECGYVASDAERARNYDIGSARVRGQRRPDRPHVAALARGADGERRVLRLPAPRPRHGVDPVTLGRGIALAGRGPRRGWPRERRPPGS